VRRKSVVAVVGVLLILASVLTFALVMLGVIPA
jgi:hypothetical protein